MKGLIMLKDKGRKTGSNRTMHGSDRASSSANRKGQRSSNKRK